MTIFHFTGCNPSKPTPPFFIFLIGIVSILASCSATRQSSYVLKNIPGDTIVNNSVPNLMELKIQPADRLSISISSLNPEQDVIFNAPGESKSNLSGYLVNTDGNIYLHKLGKLPVSGLTRRELKVKLEEALQPFFRDPVISVNFENHRITILGEAGLSKIVDMPAERLSIFEALGAGNTNFQNINLGDVVVIREKEDKKEIKHLDLENHSVFGSAWYYLQPNDVVVLTPDKEKIDFDERRQRNQQIATFILQGVSLAVIIYSNFIRK